MIVCEAGKSVCGKSEKQGFLEVIIGEDRVRIEKEKVQGVIEWLVPRNTKDVQKFFGASKLLQMICERTCQDNKALA